MFYDVGLGPVKIKASQKDVKKMLWLFDAKGPTRRRRPSKLEEQPARCATSQWRVPLPQFNALFALDFAYPHLSS